LTPNLSIIETLGSLRVSMKVRDAPGPCPATAMAFTVPSGPPKDVRFSSPTTYIWIHGQMFKVQGLGLKV